MQVTLRPLTKQDALAFWELAFADSNAEWRQWDGPYFNDHYPSREEWLAGAARRYLNNPLRQVIWVDGQMVGSVSARYEDGDLKRWLDVGITVYTSTQWGQGIGRIALSLWVDKLFAQIDLPHIGLTTWSGNIRMMRLAERLGMQQEARIRQVRYWQGRYYDSVKYGILRSEWKTNGRI